MSGKHLKKLPELTEGHERKEVVEMITTLRDHINPATRKRFNLTAISLGAGQERHFAFTALNQDGACDGAAYRGLKSFYEDVMKKNPQRVDKAKGAAAGKMLTKGEKKRLYLVVQQLLTIDNPATGRKHSQVDISKAVGASATWAWNTLKTKGGSTRQYFEKTMEYYREVIEEQGLKCESKGPDGLHCDARLDHRGKCHAPDPKHFGETVEWEKAGEEIKMNGKRNGKPAEVETPAPTPEQALQDAAAGVVQMRRRFEIGLEPALRDGDTGLARIPAIRHHLAIVIEQVSAMVCELPKNMRGPSEAFYDAAVAFHDGLDS